MPSPRLCPPRRSFAVAVSLSLAVIAAGCSKDESADPPSTTTTSTTTSVAEPSTTAPLVPVRAPLTGVEVPIEQTIAMLRPALAIKIDNSPEALPQAGLNSTDLVWEIMVEGISRLLAVFHSKDTDVVGPVRSARLSDVGILRLMGQPLFGWSGANRGVEKAIFGSYWIKSVHWGKFDNSDYQRRSDRRAPHNLYTSTEALFAHAEAGQTPPGPIFQYLAAGQTNPTAVPTPGVSLSVGDTPSSWVWDGGAGHWLRWQYGKRDLSEEDGQVAASNVVILETKYTNKKGSPVAQLLGTGKATVLVNGQSVDATWSRPNEPEPLTVTVEGGQPVLLTPGNSWIELTDGASETPLTQAAADKLLAGK